MTASTHAPLPNQLLAALPANQRRAFLADCTGVDLAPGAVLYEQGERIRFVYFPTGSVISMLATVDRNSTIEIGMIGIEGMCGFTVMLGNSASPLRALIQGAGQAWRMKATSFLHHLETLSALRPLLDRYACVILRQLAQTAACTRFHVLEKRLARWLLMTQDRAHSNTLEITQAFLAHMLGVRRVGVTEAARALQSRKVIHYSRGKLEILSRKRLEAAACACYRSDLDTYKHGMARA